MNGSFQPFRECKLEEWEDDASLSSVYEQGHRISYRNNRISSNNEYGPENVSTFKKGESTSTYTLEHLATFRVSPESGLVYPSDGMRRLLHMEKTTGIWTQKMHLKMENEWILILSHENGDVVEKFPMNLIRDPTAFTSEDPKELYNNIFIFVVSEDSNINFDNPTEMHIFQCLSIGAKDLVEHMKIFLSGKCGNNEDRHKNIIDRITTNHSSDIPFLEDGYHRDLTDGDEIRDDITGRRSERSSISHNDEISSTSSERYERDVAILNNCFDDIERFIARLQHTAAATKELERRRRSRKSKKKNIGDGLLSMRAKPPPEKDFIDILQKFKLSFNLLAKLRAHIRDPNAPELVHFLFTPLALIVDASRDTHAEPPLPPQVTSPVLTQDAIELLTNCLTSRETELWHSLGEAWLISKEAWKYPVIPYRPAFVSGWAPELSDELVDRKYPVYTERIEDIARREKDEKYIVDRREPIANQHYNRRESRSPSLTPVSEFQNDDLELENFERTQRKWFEELKGRNSKIVQVTYPRTANNEKELTVARGEYLEVIDDSKKWWKARNSQGLQAHVPHTIVTPYSTIEVHPEVRQVNKPMSTPPKDDMRY